MNASRTFAYKAWVLSDATLIVTNGHEYTYTDEATDATEGGYAVFTRVSGREREDDSCPRAGFAVRRNASMSRATDGETRRVSFFGVNAQQFPGFSKSHRESRHESLLDGKDLAS